MVDIKIPQSAIPRADKAQEVKKKVKSWRGRGGGGGGAELQTWTSLLDRSPKKRIHSEKRSCREGDQGSIIPPNWKAGEPPPARGTYRQPAVGTDQQKREVAVTVLRGMVRKKTSRK
ncbi:hypothetical protein BJX63DRAFT_281065 [Aspergillus granulosus]|uniref:Uncharacterized protein n=1 Tax=Aspergillus granulosus TaxID=176169 RepID=A0ABR4HYZ7_9EURO